MHCTRSKRRVSGEVYLSEVHSVWAGRQRSDGQHIDSKSMCDACCPTMAFVTLGLPPSHLLATTGATKRSQHNKTFILVGDDRKDATAATKLILETKSGAMAAGAASAPLVDAVRCCRPRHADDGALWRRSAREDQEAQGAPRHRRVILLGRGHTATHPLSGPHPAPPHDQ